MNELLAFLEARIAEDEDVAKTRPADAHIHASGCYYYEWNLDANWFCDCDENGISTRRLEGEIATKRAIIKTYHSCWDAEIMTNDFGPKLVASGMVKGLEIALKCLANPYATHPDYQEEWGRS